MAYHAPLSPGYSETLRAMRFLGESADEIARVLGRSVAAVKWFRKVLELPERELARPPKQYIAKPSTDDTSEEKPDAYEAPIKRSIPPMKTTVRFVNVTKQEARAICNSAPASAPFRVHERFSASSTSAQLCLEN